MFRIIGLLCVVAAISIVVTLNLSSFIAFLNKRTEVYCEPKSEYHFLPTIVYDREETDEIGLFTFFAGVETRIVIDKKTDKGMLLNTEFYHCY